MYTRREINFQSRINRYSFLTIVGILEKSGEREKCSLHFNCGVDMPKLHVHI